MIIIVHNITKDRDYLSNAHLTPMILRPWWVREGASRIRYWTYRERFLNES